MNQDPDGDELGEEGIADSVGNSLDRDNSSSKDPNCQDFNRENMANGNNLKRGELQHCLAMIPVRSINTPFRSTFLGVGVKPFTSILMKIIKCLIDTSQLIGKYTGNMIEKLVQHLKTTFSTCTSWLIPCESVGYWLIRTSAKILLPQLEPLLNFSSLFFMFLSLSFKVCAMTLGRTTIFFLTACKFCPGHELYSIWYFEFIRLQITEFTLHLH